MDISTNWTSNINLNQALIVQDVSNFNTEEGIPFDPESTIELFKTGDSICSIEISSRQPEKQIKRIFCFTESRLIEVYIGHLKEYWGTVEEDFCASCEDLTIYKTDIIFNQPTESCLLKLVKPDRRDKVCVLGFLILTEPNLLKTSPSSIDFDAVDKLLGRITLSENAEKLKSFLQMQNNVPNINPMTQAMNIFSNFTLNANSNSAIEMQRGAESLNLNQQQGDEENSKNKELVNTLKQYFDYKLILLEQKIVQNFDKKLKEFEERQNEKFNIVINLLNKNK